METTTPFVSIIIPCYNDFEYIEAAVKSAYYQTYPQKEIIVVDDGSDARTKSKLRDLEGYTDAILVQKNGGQSAARNYGIKNARGSWILVLDSDDYFESNFLELAVLQVSELEVSLVTCWARCFTDTREWIYKPKGGGLRHFLFENAAIGNALFKKTDFITVGGYDESMRTGWEDWEFYIRLMALGGVCKVIPQVLFHYRKRNGSTTSRANKNKYYLYNYIFRKHEILYSKYYPETIDFFLEKLRREELEKIKNTQRLEFHLGKAFLYPLRLFKSLWK
ncbi:glycosyltransferase family 2 protein [Leeuwenhoekiella sp. ZYFB001]|uniref:glycosyltransferase family 2 protein n=1 Tax=Leeuwenhoekiella sp. ZYFB001 TaxID=2719912 RepID=UPI0014319DDC|nr:glycosyltransferase family A protein [Leeuwenhoekiella sp. ZYFB001]